MSSQEYNEDHYGAIEEMAANGFSMEEIAEVIASDDQLFLPVMQNKHSSFYQAYRKGFLKSQLELRQRIFKDAKNGSSPAQMLAKKILDDAAYKMDQ